MVKCLKEVLVFFIILYLSSLSMCQDLLENRFLKASCNTSQIGTCKDLLCNVTSFGALNFGFTFTRELKTFDVQIIAFMIKNNGVYQRILKHPKFKWCDFVRKAKVNPFYKVLLTYLKNMAPKTVTPCPYSGKYYFYNLKLMEYYSMFPSGEYQVAFQLSDAIDKNIFRLTYHTFIETPIKFNGK